MSPQNKSRRKPTKISKKTLGLLNSTNIIIWRIHVIPSQKELVDYLTTTMFSTSQEEKTILLTVPRIRVMEWLE